MDPNRADRVPGLAAHLLQTPPRAHSRNLWLVITTDSGLTVRYNFKHRSRKSSRVRRFPLTQGYVGEIDLAGCGTNTMRRQHDGTEFVHPSGFRAAREG